jgi:cyclic pyranopterin phosphate synthase
VEHPRDTLPRDTLSRDTFGRPLGSLRISVTDRCNLRCGYCMPEEEYVWLPHPQFLRFEELATIAQVFVGLGVDRIRLTGGEPLMRRDLPVLVQLLASVPGIRDLALTTNGVMLADHADALFDAGLQRITVSLDTLQPERFRAITRRDSLLAVRKGIETAASAMARHGRRGLKIDSVVIRGTNDDELGDLLGFGRAHGAEVRFIEYMDVGGATRWSVENVVSRAEMLDRIAATHGSVEPIVEESNAPAKRFRLPDGTTFGIIASTTQPFCSACDRTRLLADGRLLLCLYARNGLDLRGPLREGATPEQLAAQIAAVWQARTDRGAEERLRSAARAPLASADELRSEPHLEMHTRGG